MKINKSALFVLIAGCFLAGCVEDKGNNTHLYVGHWVETGSADIKPMTLDIQYDGKTVLVDEKKTVFGKEFESKVVGKPQPDSSVKFEYGVGNTSMTLMDGRLLYKGRVLVKSP